MVIWIIVVLVEMERSWVKLEEFVDGIIVMGEGEREELRIMF